MGTEKSVPVQRVIRATSMMPWGWPCDAADSSAKVDIPDGTPCVVIQGAGGGPTDISVVEFSESGRTVQVEIENQFLRTP